MSNKQITAILNDMLRRLSLKHREREALSWLIAKLLKEETT